MADDKIQQLIPAGASKVGIRGLRTQAKAELAKINPQDCPNRYAIGFDDSGSMLGEPLANAKLGVTNFISQCSQKETSICVYTFDGKTLTLTVDYTALNVFIQGLTAPGGTPFFRTCHNLLQENITRAVIFSDGAPDYDDPTQFESKVHELAKQKKIPFDCVYIGHGDNAYMKKLSEVTGGHYVKFEDAATLSKQLKYLSPRYVALLSNADLKAKIERGETI